MSNTIYQGDALAVLQTLPDCSVQCCVTSPPYFGLRSYLPDGHPDKPLEIGLEETPGEYIEKLVQVFREVRRVLRNDGVCWLNLGDSYAGSGKGSGGKDHGKLGHHAHKFLPTSKCTELPSKNLLMIPARVAIALQDDGWYLRSDIIWHKPTAMPESVTDRPTSAHEHIFLLAKSERYFYDADAIAEPTLVGANGSSFMKGKTAARTDHQGKSDYDFKPTRNKRNVWTVTSQPYAEAHFATMPPKLVEPCILAGTSPQACEHCGAPWQRVTERTPMIIRNGPKAGGYGSCTTDGLSGTMVAPAESHTVGWQPTCTCINIGSGKCVVIDPFLGAGTVAMVALQHNRQYIGIDLNPEYIELARKRIATIQPVLWSLAEEVSA